MKRPKNKWPARFSAVVLLVLMGLVQSAAADPSPTLNYLMNTPVSHLTLGMRLLELQMQNVIRNETAYGYNVDYDWDANKIVLLMFCINAVKSDDEFSELSRRAVHLVRAQAGVQDDGKLLTGVTHSFFANLFTDPGYVSKNQPKDLEEKIDKTIEIRVQGTDATGHTLKSHAPLVGSGFVVEKSSQ